MKIGATPSGHQIGVDSLTQTLRKLVPDGNTGVSTGITVDLNAIGVPWNGFNVELAFFGPTDVDIADPFTFGYLTNQLIFDGVTVSTAAGATPAWRVPCGVTGPNGALGSIQIRRAKAFTASSNYWTFSAQTNNLISGEIRYANGYANLNT